MNFGEWFYKHLCKHGKGKHLILHKSDLTHGKVVVCQLCLLTMHISEKIWKEWTDRCQTSIT